MFLLAYIFGARGKIDNFKAIKYRNHYWFHAGLHGWCEVTNEASITQFYAESK